MFPFLQRHLGTRWAWAITCMAYALLILLIAAKWGTGDANFRYLAL